MHITKCQYNHYYDLDNFDKCPFCKSTPDVMQDEMTVAYDAKTSFEEAQDIEQLTQSYSDNVTSNGKTIGVSLLHQQVNPIAGWFVCTNGPAKGRFYAVYSGKNFIGRSRGMDIAITGDADIAKEKHCCITYDPKNIQFFITAVNGTASVNDNPLTGSIQIHDSDLIQIGQTEFEFVQYCNEERNWNA